MKEYLSFKNIEKKAMALYKFYSSSHKRFAFYPYSYVQVIEIILNSGHIHWKISYKAKSYLYSGLQKSSKQGLYHLYQIEIAFSLYSFSSSNLYLHTFHIFLLLTCCATNRQQVRTHLPKPLAKVYVGFKRHWGYEKIGSDGWPCPTGGWGQGLKVGK